MNSANVGNVIFKYVIVVAFVVVFFMYDSASLGYVSGGPVINHLLFAFSHVSILHLVLNSLVLINMFDIVRLRLRVNPIVLFINIFLVSFVSSFLSVGDMPTVGASGMIYALFGLYIASMNSLGKPNLVFISSILFMLVISYFKKSSNFEIHFFSLLLSGICWGIYRVLKKVPSGSASA